MKKKTKQIKKMWNKAAKRLIKAICAGLTSLLVIACGSTKVAVSKPAEGTSTTVTVTTNNPITTNINPQTDVTL